MKEENQFEVPFQVQMVIDSLKNKNERPTIRGNYRMRLESIKMACDRAIFDYDVEMGITKPLRYGKGQR